MVLGIGTDILKIDRLSPETLTPADSFFKKTFTADEAEEAVGRPNPLHYFATRFAGKEATFKALRLHPDGVRLCEIEILTSLDGSPYVILHGRLLKTAEEKGIDQILLSLSYDTEYAVAYALAQGEGPGHK